MWPPTGAYWSVPLTRTRNSGPMTMSFGTPTQAAFMPAACAQKPSGLASKALLAKSSSRGSGGDQRDAPVLGTAPRTQEEAHPGGLRRHVEYFGIRGRAMGDDRVRFAVTGGGAHASIGGGHQRIERRLEAHHLALFADWFHGAQAELLILPR